MSNFLNVLIPIAQAHTDNDYFGHHMMFNGSGWGLMGGIFMIIFWILLIVGIVYLIKYVSQNQDKKQEKDPIDILKERFARGEIDKEEFEEKKKDLI